MSATIGSKPCIRDAHFGKVFSECFGSGFPEDFAEVKKR
jgi:hypothetical protein